MNSCRDCLLHSELDKLSTFSVTRGRGRIMSLADKTMLTHQRTHTRTKYAYTYTRTLIRRANREGDKDRKVRVKAGERKSLPGREKCDGISVCIGQGSRWSWCTRCWTARSCGLFGEQISERDPFRTNHSSTLPFFNPIHSLISKRRRVSITARTQTRARKCTRACTRT
jgi:hypothetical protein